MNRGYKSWLVVSFSVITFFLVGKGIMDNQTTVNASEEATVNPYHKPTSDPVRFFIFWLTTGYDLQPQSQYTFVGNPKKLSTSVGLSWWDRLWHLTASPHFEWYTSSDYGKKWNKMKKEKDKSITVTPNSVGTVHYQQYARWYTILPGITDPDAYSKVASVTTLPDPINAISLKVNSDLTYLYNNQDDPDTTYAHAVPTPINSTGDITWSIDNEELASIDQETGLITANIKKKSGIAKVTGTMTNFDGSKVSDSVDVEIGGGLEDQTVNEGKKATFKVQGMDSGEADSVVWHKVTNGNDTVIETSKSLSYTTPPTSYKDNDTKYYAEIKIVQEGKSMTLKTNQANLKVILNKNPDILISSTILNKSFENHNDENTVINNVAENDVIVYNSQISDRNPNSKATSGLLTVKVPVDFDLKELDLDGNQYGNYVEVLDDNDGSTKNIFIFDIKMTASKNHSLSVSGIIGDIKSESYKSYLKFTAVDDEGNEIYPEYRSNDLTINYTANNIVLQANKIKYGEINYKNIKKPLSGKLDSDIENEAVKIVDSRREKNPQKIYISEEKPMIDSMGNKMHADLRYYHSVGDFDTLSNGSTLVYKSETGETLDSIYWKNNLGLNLFLYDLNSPKADYEAKLTWTVVNSV